MTEFRRRNIELPPQWCCSQNDYSIPVCHPFNDIPWYTAYFGDVCKRIDTDSLIVHNGIWCGSSSGFINFSGKDEHLVSIALLADQYRPMVGISRSKILGISLELACEFVLIQEALRREGFNTSDRLYLEMKDKPGMIPTSSYKAVLQKRPDLVGRLIIDTEEGSYRCDELKPLVTHHRQCCVYLKNLTQRYVGIDDVKYQLILAYLKQHYDLYISIYDNFDEYKIYIREKAEEQKELYNDIFPPSLFLFPDSECRYLTSDGSFRRHFCNADHRLSKFVLQNADLLQEKVPGILKEMIRILQEDSDEQLISGINDLLDRLRSLPCQPIQVPSDLYLTTEDLYKAKRVYEAYDS